MKGSFLILLTACFFLLIGAPVWSVRPYQSGYVDPVLQPWRWRTFPELKGQGLRCLAQARDGAMWFGTSEGVRRYDGAHWTVYTPEEGLLAAPVNALCAARDGSVYAGTEWGIGRFYGGAWQRVFPRQDALPWPVDRIVEQADGSIWAATAWGALRLTEDRALLYTTADMGAAVKRLAPEVELVAVPDEAAPMRPWGVGPGVQVIKGSFTGISRGQAPAVIWKLAPGSPAAAASLQVGDWVLAVEGVPPEQPHLSLQGAAGTTVILQVKRPGEMEPFAVTLTRTRLAGGVRDFALSDVCADQRGGLWLGLVRGGEVLYFDPAETRSWHLYTLDDGLAGGERRRIAQTPDGGIWAISNDDRGGLNRFDGTSWTSFRLSDMPDGNDFNTGLLVTADSTLWVGARNGRLLALRDTTWTVYAPRFAPPIGVQHRRPLTLRDTTWTVHAPRFAPPTGAQHRRRTASPDRPPGFALPAGAQRQRRTALPSTHLPRLVPLPNSQLIDMVETSDGSLWIAGLDQEAVRLEYRMDRWATYQGLQFHFETTEGERWFVSRPHFVVRYDGQSWWRYGPEDGLMASSVGGLLNTRDGSIWAVGSHRGQAATAVFDPDGLSWTRQLHPHLGSEVDANTLLEAADGALWFGAMDVLKKEHLGGLLRFDGRTWTHFTGAEVPIRPFALAQTADGMLWVGGPLRRFDGETWISITEPRALTGWIHDICAADNGDLWVGTQAYGAFLYDGQTWRQYREEDGLLDSDVDAILEMADGSILVSTNGGYSRFDGRVWYPHVLPIDIKRGAMRGGLRQSQDGVLWVIHMMHSIRYKPDTEAPDTRITHHLDEVSRRGNTTLTWEGIDPWKATPKTQLQYAWRLNEAAWSPFSGATSHTFLSLPSGDHTFEVRARDRDFNEDPTPAQVRFAVLAPVWRRPWFIGMVVAFVGIIGLQASRLVAGNRILQARNQALRQTGQQLEAASQAKSAFLASISHELRTPMNAILGFTELLERNREQNLQERQVRNLATIHRNAGNLLGLIDQLLDLSKIEAGRMEVAPESFDIREVVQESLVLVESMRRHPSVALTAAYEGDVPAFHTDRGKVRQIVVNLLGNAVKFTESGRIEVRVSCWRDQARIAVVDTGLGIPVEALETIFEEFGQAHRHTQQRGTGLGLPITRRLCHLLGGEIEVESTSGQGSAFTVTLPVHFHST